MKCYNCGGKNNDDSKFCSYCGVFLQYIPTKLYPNCMMCKWKNEDRYNWPTCSAQGYASLQEDAPYGTPSCFGVYEQKI